MDGIWYNFGEFKGGEFMISRRRFAGLAAGAGALAAFGKFPGASERFKWPEPGKVKVCQCWDDSIETDIKMMEICRRHNAKATFNLIPRDKRNVMYMKKRDPNGIFCWSRKSEMVSGETAHVPAVLTSEMPEVYKGFKVAGHNYVTHSDKPKDIEWAVKSCADMLAFIRGKMGQKDVGYVYPGGGTSKVAEKIVREAGFLYARTTRSMKVGEPLAWSDAMYLPSNGEWWKADFKERYEKVKEKGGVFYFWGHSCELGYDMRLWDKYEGIIDMISSDRDAEWIDVIDLFI